MSEYQYYEFQALDAPLDDKAKKHLRSISSRAEITSTSLTNEYHFGDFKGNPLNLVKTYFDLFVYYANWGTHEAMIRVPVAALPPAEAKAYSLKEVLTVCATPTHTILAFSSRDEEGLDDEWWEGNRDWAPMMATLRNEVLSGDLRCLYIAWLAEIQYADEDDDREEPPVPAGMDKLSGAHKRFAEFLYLDPDILTAAGAANQGAAPSGPTDADMEAWIAAQPSADKDAWLAALVRGDKPRLGSELLSRIRQDWLSGRGAKGQARSDKPRRTVGEIVRAAKAVKERRVHREKEQAARKKAKGDAEKAVARAKHLDSLAGSEKQMWQSVENMMTTNLAGDHARIVQTLKDLADLAERKGTRSEVLTRIRELCDRHARKRKLMEKVAKAGLLTEEPASGAVRRGGK